MAVVISGTNNSDKITATDGLIDLLSSVNFASEVSVPSFKVGSDIQFGNAGIITATTLVGNVTGNINHTSNLLLQISGSEKFRVGTSGQLGIGGANYGTSGQVLTSAGSGSAATWSDIPTQITINNASGNRIITSDGGTTLNGESNLTYDGTNLQLITDANNEGIKLNSTSTGSSYPVFEMNANRSVGNTLGKLISKWNGTEVASIQFSSGTDGTNKDDAHIHFNTASAGTATERLRIDSSGRLLVGAGAAANPKSSGAGSIDLDNQAFSIIVGGNHPSGGRSNNNAKTFRMSMVHYALAEEPINILQGYCDSSDNNLYIGGGTGSANSLTSVRIYTGANTTTTGGTERFRIHSAGQIGLGGANYGSSGQVLTSQGSGSAATWSTISGTTINNNANNRLITGSGTANTLEGEADLTFEKVNGVDPTFTFKRSSAASGNDNIYTELRFQNTSGTNMGQIICRRESSTDNAYLDFETKTDGENSQPSMRIKGQQGTAYFVGNLGRTNNNQPAYMSDVDYYNNTHLSTVNIQTRTNGGECGLFVRGRGQGGGSSAAHSCIRVDATSCANNADQYGIYIKGRQQLISDTTGIYADVYGSYSTTYCFRGHLQKQIGAYTTGTTFYSKITVTSSGGDAFHMRGYDGSSERIRINRNGDLDNTNNSYGSLSDVKLKENIVDANSQWNDIKALKVRNFNFKDDPDKVKMLGLVAQEAEAVSAGLVKTDNDIEIDGSTGEGKVTGTTKYLKYSILYMKAIKALQEAQTRIETLESKVAVLEGS